MSNLGSSTGSKHVEVQRRQNAHRLKAAIQAARYDQERGEIRFKARPERTQNLCSEACFLEEFEGHVERPMKAGCRARVSG